MRRTTLLLAFALATLQLAVVVPARHLPPSPGFGAASIKPLKQDEHAPGWTIPAAPAVTEALLQDPALYGGALRRRHTERLA